MDLDKAILLRKSIRKYLDKEVSLKKVAEIIDLAKNAPSSGNLQNWCFVVVTDKDKKNELATASLKQYWMNTAPVHIVVCADLERAKDYYGTRGEKLYSIQNCANITMLILLKSASLGLNTCLVGAFDESAVSRILKLPSHMRPLSIITLGYGEADKRNTKRISVDKIMFFDEYGTKEAESGFWPLESQKERLEEAVERGKKKVKGFLKKLKKH